MIRPNTPTRSSVSGRSGWASVPMTNGMSEMCVIRWRATTSQKRLVDHFGVSTTVAPTPSTGKNVQLCAFTWKNGR